MALRLGNIAFVLHGVPVSKTTGSIAALLGVFITLSVAQAATVIAVSNLHLERGTTIRSAYTLARSAFGRVIWISFVAGIVIPCLIGAPIGFLLAMALALVGLGKIGDGLLVGAVAWIVMLAVAAHVWLRWALAVPVTVLEKTSLRSTMRRSRFLTRNTLGRIFVVFILVFALTWAVRAMFQLPVFALERWSVVRRGQVAHNGSLILLALGASAGAILVGPLLTIALTLQYYDSRVRKEAFDMEFMMANLANGSAPPAVSSTV